MSLSKVLSMPLWDQCISLIQHWFTSFIFSRPLSCGLISRVVDEYDSNFKSFFFFFSLKSELFEWIDCKFPMLSRVQLTIKKTICMNKQFSDNCWNFRCICVLFRYSSWKKLIGRWHEALFRIKFPMSFEIRIKCCWYLFYYSPPSHFWASVSSVFICLLINLATPFPFSSMLST